jgi:DNA-binding ferritin-like protein
MKTNILNYINKLQGYKTAIKNLHWSSKHMSEHKLLDEIADSVANNQDEIAEMCQGLYGKIKINELKPKRYKITNSKKMLFDLLRDTKSFNSSIKGRELTGVRSVVEAFIGEINKFVYLMDMCIKEDIKRNFKSSLNESNSIINETLLRETIQKAIKKSLNEWEDPFDEVGLEDIPIWEKITVPHEDLWDCYVYNKKDECVGRLGDLHFIYSPKKNKYI